MKNTLIAFALMAAGITILSYLLPWWVSVIWVIAVCILLKLNIRQSIFTAGISFSLVWLVAALMMLMQDDTGFIGKAGELLGGLSAMMMVMVVFVVAFITGCLSGWTGGALGYYLRSQNSNNKIR